MPSGRLRLPSHQQRDTADSQKHAGQFAWSESVAEPYRGHNRAEEWAGRVENRRHRCTDILLGKTEQREGQCRVDQADNCIVAPALPQRGEVSAGERDY